MTIKFNKCRFCKKTEFDHPDGPTSGMFKYGVRHYAHFHCYLDAGKTLENLNRWQVGNFPYFFLKERGLLETANAIIKGTPQ